MSPDAARLGCNVIELFMTDRGQDAGTAFSRNVWLHDGLDILAVSLLLFVLSTMAITRKTLLGAATVALAPVAAILYSLLATDFWSPLFLIPAAAAAAFAVYGFLVRTAAHGSESRRNCAAERVYRGRQHAPGGRSHAW